MKLSYLLAFIAANTLASSAVPIPQTQIISPYVTQFTQRAIPHRVRSKVAGLVSRIPDVLSIKRVDRDDIFLARALEGAVFASARDFMPPRSDVETKRDEPDASSDQ
ncbi:hypothetical protein B0H16DRAFT_240191 [Mycena metata]|uniref:Uncharacterized protein n=1 Tax=Mycena metata TaxID=1033252 RepID=A0AAD7MRI8_9AGAR|nr:hypothetical protein B0H16DRAFT_240191 [Mycena metata]